MANEKKDQILLTAAIYSFPLQFLATSEVAVMWTERCAILENLENSNTTVIQQCLVEPCYSSDKARPEFRRTVIQLHSQCFEHDLQYSFESYHTLGTNRLEWTQYQETTLFYY